MNTGSLIDLGDPMEIFKSFILGGIYLLLVLAIFTLQILTLIFIIGSFIRMVTCMLGFPPVKDKSPQPTNEEPSVKDKQNEDIHSWLNDLHGHGVPVPPADSNNLKGREFHEWHKNNC